MERNIWLLADDPAVVWPWRNVEQLALAKLNYGAVLKGNRRAPGEHKPNMLDRAMRRVDSRPDVQAPAPARLINSAPDRQAPYMNQLEATFLEFADFIRSIESFENDL